jgi:hypothetical protein
VAVRGGGAGPVSSWFPPRNAAPGRATGQASRLGWLPTTTLVAPTTSWIACFFDDAVDDPCEDTLPPAREPDAVGAGRRARLPIRLLLPELPVVVPVCRPLAVLLPLTLVLPRGRAETARRKGRALRSLQAVPLRALGGGGDVVRHTDVGLRQGRVEPRVDIAAPDHSSQQRSWLGSCGSSYHPDGCVKGPTLPPEGMRQSHTERSTVTVG